MEVQRNTDGDIPANPIGTVLLKHSLRKKKNHYLSSFLMIHAQRGGGSSNILFGKKSSERALKVANTVVSIQIVKTLL